MRMLLFVLVLALAPFAYAEEADMESPQMPLATGEEQLWQPCYMQCLDDGQYAHICEPICSYGDSKAPQKLTANQYECYRSCIGNEGWGALFCLERCRGWGRTLEMQDRDLPPLPGVQ